MTGTEERRENKTNGFSAFSIITLAAGIVLILFTTLVAVPLCIERGVQTAEEKFIDTVSQTESDIRDKIYTAAFDLSEMEHHVSNNAVVEIKCIELTQKLEVLRVSDTEYVFTGKSATQNVKPEQKFDNDINVDVWFEVTGTGSFTVDLTQAEVIMDNARKHISVVIPAPEVKCMAKVTEEYDKNDINPFNDSTAEGMEISQTAEKKGQKLVDESISSDPNYMDSARTAAKRLLSNMIKSLNAEEIPDLSVDISFFDEQV